MNKKETLDLAKWAIGVAQKSGAAEASVDIAKWRDISIEHRDGQLDKLEESTQNSMSVTIYADNRYSSHSTNDLRKESLKSFIADAVSLTKYLGEDPQRTLPDPKYYVGQKDIELGIFDPNYNSVTSEQRVKMARDLQTLTTKLSDKVVSCTAYAGDTQAVSVKVNSNGFEGFRKSTSFYSEVSASIDDGSGGIPSDWDGVTVRYYKDIPNQESIAKGAIDRVMKKIGQSKLESGLYDMVVENRTATRILGQLYGPLRGRSLQQKSSCYAEKLGEQIASDKLSFIDDPFVKNGLGSRLYDGEGMATQKRVIIDKGVLNSYYIGTYYGNKLGMEPTIGSRTNVIIQPGTKSLDELIAHVKKGIFVTSFVGGNSNSTTGDFSRGIIGMYIENGKLIKPVNEMNITGNALDFWKKLADVGNDVYAYSSWKRPSLYFKDIQFSGI